MLHLMTIFIAAIFTHNIALTYLLGMCPFVSLSRNLNTASGMAFAVIFVVTLTAAVNWPIYHLILVPTGSELIFYIVFIIIIAAFVQLVEMIMEKFLPALQASFGIFLPLITTNCAVLGLALFATLRDYSFIESVAYGVGAGVGFTLAITIMAGIREELRFSDVPKAMEGPAITLMVAGLLALAFMGFSGLLTI